MAHVVEINQIEELEHYYLIWNNLWPQTPGATFFHSLDWVKTFWQHFGRHQKLRVLIVYRDGAPIGILPLTITHEQTRVGRIRVLTYPLQDWASFFGPIGPHPAETLLAAAQHIRQTRRGWDLLDLRWVDRDAVRHDALYRDTSDRGHTPQAMQAAGFHARESVWKETAIIDCRGTWDQYWADRTAKFRNNLRRQEKKAAELGKVEYIRYRPRGAAFGEADPRWDLYDVCVGLAERSWQGSSPDGTTLSHTPVRRFFRDAHALAARTGTLDLNLLKINGRPAAFAYNYHCQGYVFGLRIGYDPDFARIAVGNLLYLRSFRDSFQRGDQTFDMGTGSLEIKRDWLTTIGRIYRYTHYPIAAPRIQLLRVKHWMQRRFCQTDEAAASKNARCK